MAKAEQITLAKALKVKNRLADRLNQVGNDIRTWNSVLSTQKGQVDVRAMMKQRESLASAVVAIKLAIDRANTEIRQVIYELAEKRNTLTFITAVPSRHGKEANAYREQEFEYIAEFQKKELDAMKKTLEKEVDQLQDKLETFNATKRVEIEAVVLELAS